MKQLIYSSNEMIKLGCKLHKAIVYTQSKLNATAQK